MYFILIVTRKKKHLAASMKEMKVASFKLLFRCQTDTYLCLTEEKLETLGSHALLAFFYFWS